MQTIMMETNINTNISRLCNFRKLKKWALKKPILDTRTKTANSFKNKFYQQKDGAGIGSSLGPVIS